MSEIKRLPIDGLFKFKVSDAIKNNEGKVIEFDVLPDRTDHTKNMLATPIDAYVFPIDETIDVGIALDENIPLLICGLHGSGKSSLAEQIAIRTNRPSMRIQHSVSTEEADIIGNWALEGDKTVFHLGPLARAMRDGLIYIADEYDFALPNVLSIYQAVLEGGALFIKNAPEHLSIIKPHPDFRFIATGNTNGSGDETGLYQGTQLQNAANYSRFGITVQLGYSKSENQILKAHFDSILDADVKVMIDFAKMIRKAYEDRTITNTISTRELIAATRLAILRGRAKLNFRYGIKKAFTGRMSSIDAAAIMEIVDKVFEK